MRNLICAFFVLMGLYLVPTQGAAQDQRELARYVDQSVGRVVVKVPKGVGYGSGYVVDAGRNGKSFLFLTNNHVVEGGQQVKVVYAGAERLYIFQAEVLRTSEVHDMALLRLTAVDDHDFEPEILPLADYTIEQGDSVYAVGFPGFSDDFVVRDDDLDRYEPTITSGIVGKRFKGYWFKKPVLVEQLQHNAAINSGNSGGPLVNPCGTVVGLNTAKPTEEGVDGAFLSSSAKTILDFLEGTIADPKMAGRACSGWQGFLFEPRTLILIASVAVLLTGLIFFRRQQATAGAGPSAPPGGPMPPPQPPASPRVKPMLRAAIQGKSVPLDAQKLTKGVMLGRGDHVDVRVDHAKLSREHAELRLRDRKLYIIDQGSTNGTTVDGKKLSAKSPQQINTRSQIALGGVPLTLTKGD